MLLYRIRYILFKLIEFDVKKKRYICFMEDLCYA